MSLINRLPRPLAHHTSALSNADSVPANLSQSLSQSIARCSTSTLPASIRGSFVEHSSSAGSYRGKLPGLPTTHLFLLAAKEYYDRLGILSRIYCDNKSTIYSFQKKPRQVATGVKHAGVHQVLWCVKLRMQSTYSKHHTEAHQGVRKRCLALLVESQLNCGYDDLAIAAIAKAITDNRPVPSTQCLPLKDTYVMINGKRRKKLLLQVVNPYIMHCRILWI